MAERAVFLDRDNTIIEDKEGFVGEVSRVKVFPGAATAIAALRRLGYRIIVVSNQSGVARGMFDEAAVEAVNQEMCRQLREQAGAHIDASYYCPYHPDAVVPEYRVDHEWRKPKPGMLKQAAEDFSLDLGQCWVVGDMPRDIASGAAVGCRTILVRDPEHPPQENPNNALEVSPNFIVKSLADAARVIAREGKNPHPGLAPAEKPEAGGKKQEELSPPQDAAPRGTEAPPATMEKVDEEALAEKVARRLEKTMAKGENLKPVLDEMLMQLRQQTRAGEIPEFSLARLGAILVQVLVVICLLVAVWDALATLPPAGYTAEWYTQTQRLIRAGLWLLGAGVLQGMVIALYLGGRR